MEVIRNNLTAMPYKEWASKLATSFELASINTTNTFLKNWYLEQAIELWNSLLRKNMPNYVIGKIKRQGEPSLDDTLYERIEIEFAIPVYLTQDQQKRLNELVLEILENPANEPENAVHWISSLGPKPFWESEERKSVEKWDESTLYFESSVKFCEK